MSAPAAAHTLGDLDDFDDVPLTRPKRVRGTPPKSRLRKARPLASRKLPRRRSALAPTSLAAAAADGRAARLRVDFEEARYRDYSRVVREQEERHVAELARCRRDAEFYRRDALRARRESAALASALASRERELSRALSALRESRRAEEEARVCVEEADVRHAEATAELRDELDVARSERDGLREQVAAERARARRSESEVARLVEERAEFRSSLESANRRVRRLEEQLAVQEAGGGVVERSVATVEDFGDVDVARRKDAASTVAELYRDAMRRARSSPPRHAFRSPEVSERSDDAPLMRSKDAAAAAARIDELLFGGKEKGGGNDS